MIFTSSPVRRRDKFSACNWCLAQKPLNIFLCVTLCNPHVRRFFFRWLSRNARAIVECVRAHGLIFHMINVWLNNARVTDCLRSTVCCSLLSTTRLHLLLLEAATAAAEVKSEIIFLSLLFREKYSKIFTETSKIEPRWKKQANLRRYSAHHAGMMSTTFDIVFLLVCISASLSLAGPLLAPSPHVKYLWRPENGKIHKAISTLAVSIRAMADFLWRKAFALLFFGLFINYFLSLCQADHRSADNRLRIKRKHKRIAYPID